MNRSAGILMPIISLPSKYGIGTLGKEAYRFIDFLYEASQSYWQILPIGPTGYGNSPYQSFSMYAGNHYMIDLDILYEDGYLLKDDFKKVNFSKGDNYIDYNLLYKNRLNVLKESYRKINSKDFNDFIRKNEFWLDDYSLYMALKEHFEMLPWFNWPKEIKLRKKDAIKYYTNLLSKEINFWKYIQFIFFSQWYKFKEYANSRNISIIGDIPIYVSLDSADVWSNPKNFLLDEDLRPTCVSGCPPDSFCKKGQLWGNPIYDWEYLKTTEYKYWIDKINYASNLFDVIRIDHFRGFDSYYAIDYKENTAENGIWKKGPKMDLFNTLNAKLGKLNIIAEDLGFLTDSVVELINKTGFPGMKVLQFAFNSDSKNEYLPHNYINNSVVYTGTHDNDTIMGWLNSLSKEEFKKVKKYANLSIDEGYNWGMIRLAYSSVSNLVVIPIQDFLALPSKARINFPSIETDNWRWRLTKNYLDYNLAKKIKDITETYNRNN